MSVTTKFLFGINAGLLTFHAIGFFVTQNPGYLFGAALAVCVLLLCRGQA